MALIRSPSAQLFLPRRLLTHDDHGNFSVIYPELQNVQSFDIISYTWGPTEPGRPSNIDGVGWPIILSEAKIQEIKNLMITAGIRYLWTDCLCIDQQNPEEMNREMSLMYHYYKAASKCHILLELDEVWNPQVIVDNLKLVDHVINNVHGSEFASSDRLGGKVTGMLSDWADEGKTRWRFPVERDTVRSAGVELGLLNAYATSTKYVQEVFQNFYFKRVWTFQEMLLGKNITIWGVKPENLKDIRCIGELGTWMDLAIEATDKALKLYEWINDARWTRNPSSVNAILSCIDEDKITLLLLQAQVKGIESARTDIISGGPGWWKQNFKGVANVFSAISLTPRQASKPKPDLFKGLCGVFSGLFDVEEMGTLLSENLGMDQIAFHFFRQLSTKTGLAWTRLAISSRDRGVGASFNWIPVFPDQEKPMSTDMFAGVVNLGLFKAKTSMVKTTATTGLVGTPRPYVKISLISHEDKERKYPQAVWGDYFFRFIGCNCGKQLRTGKFFGTEEIPTNTEIIYVDSDQTGRVLVQSATVLGLLFDPGADVVEYRERLLYKLQPFWTPTDRNAKPPNWAARCVSGTPYETPELGNARIHNMSMDYALGAIDGWGSRLHNDNSKGLVCEVEVNCGCRIVGPYSLIVSALTAVHGCSLGNVTAEIDPETNRIELSDGLGLIQVGDVGKTFNLVAFGGDVAAHARWARRCRRTRDGKFVNGSGISWPTGRALVKEEFTHGIGDVTRNYGYVETGGSGNLLIMRSNPLGDYKILGVCIDDKIASKKEESERRKALAEQREFNPNQKDWKSSVTIQ
ncbi:heterokaryon incompatibility protein-domain-containing protein [Cladorrhinum samala]|uniref:Heterokaryon incompatibility protein-domain-containing protein n=1 Tax=Cladorrhinum samala TaxID=585594 RepID=A0AAV9I014_9PEZI|nr:heterokaryon incompatibility protein-domain-containing protein [Cladorrhinum samala]